MNNIKKLIIYVCIVFLLTPSIIANATEIEETTVVETNDKIEDSSEKNVNDDVLSSVEDNSSVSENTTNIEEELLNEKINSSEIQLPENNQDINKLESNFILNENPIDSVEFNTYSINQVTDVENNNTTPPVEENNFITIPHEEAICSPDYCGSGGDLSIDGYYGDWGDKPYSWHYNWDNSDNCWHYGCYVDNYIYYSNVGTYNNNVRHMIQMYTDGEYIYTRIKIATIYGSKYNSEDYIYTFDDGQQAAFQITDQNGVVLTNNIENFSPGVHDVQVRHRNGDCSYGVVQGASAKLTVYDNYLNTDLEFKIPISECVYQNPSINSNAIGTIDFFTPNLMYTHIVSHGTSTAPYLIVGICFALAFTLPIIFTKRKGVK